MNNGDGAVGGHPEHRAVARVPSPRRGAVEAAVTGLDQRGTGVRAIRTAGECVQDVQLAR